MPTMSIEAIKEAIAELAEEDKSSLATWLNLKTMDEWDRDMQRDFSPGGRGCALVEKVKAEIRAGEFTPF